MDAERCTDIALAAARWTESLAIDTPDGRVWGHSAEKPTTVSRSLYNGSAGIALFEIEMHRATGAPEHLDRAGRAGDDLLAYLGSTEHESCAIYTGWPGYAFALFEIGQATGDARYTDGGRLALDRLRAAATEFTNDGDGPGLGWIEPMPFSDIHGFTGNREIYDASVGATGAGFVLLYAAEHDLHPDADTWATQVGERLLHVAELTEGGTGRNWALMSDMPFPWTPSNFAHGAAGVGTFLAMLHASTGDARFLDAALGAARHLEAISTPAGNPVHPHTTGHLVCHHGEPDGVNLFYLGACHGPVGTARLFDLLRAQQDGTDWVRPAFDALLSTGVPETRSDGFWNNVSQCCGDAGVGEWALDLYSSTADPRALDLAVRVGAELERRSVEPIGGQRCWPQAEHRQRPKFLQAQTGYMQGAAGIGSFYLRLAAVLGGTPSPKVRFPDIPAVRSGR
jgi:lantibiotic modifying enzyme